MLPPKPNGLGNPCPLWPLRSHRRVVEGGDLPSVVPSNQDQALDRAVLAGEGTGWDPEDPRGVGEDDVRRKLPGPRQLVIDAAALVDRVEDGLVPGRYRLSPAVVLAPDVDEVRVGGEGPAERP